MTGPDPEVPVLHQRLSTRVLLRRGDEVLLARIAASGYGTAGTWTLPGGGVDHGEHPADALVREVMEETGLTVVLGDVIGVFSRRFVGKSPTGVLEDYHGVHLIYAGSVVSASDEPRVVEVGGTTDAVAWVSLADIDSGTVPAAEVVRYALTLSPR